MKNYETAFAHTLMPRTPVIVRVDGRAFHSLPLAKPFDAAFGNAMVLAAGDLAKEMQGFRLGYTQSDEASFLLLDTDTFDTEPWFANDQAKIVSLAAAIMSVAFSRYWDALDYSGGIPVFDSRAFNVPADDLANYFLWRAKDCERNSVAMLAQANFSHKQLYKKGRADMHEMLHEKGINWATDVAPRFRNGVFILRDGTTTGEVLPTYAGVNTLVGAATRPGAAVDTGE